jgi:hypothetical protein
LSRPRLTRVVVEVEVGAVEVGAVVLVAGVVEVGAVVLVAGAAAEVTPAAARLGAALSAPIVHLARVVILVVAPPAVAVGREALRKGSRADKGLPVRCRPIGPKGSRPVNHLAASDNLAGRPSKIAGSKTGSRRPATGSKTGSRLPATGKKTGRTTEIMRVKTGKSMGRIITTAAAIGEEEDTMEDTPREECWRAWRSGP